MPRIYELEPHVADLIAAGEVVERPASVVKELVENSIDAGARNITIEIQSGGMKSIRIADDGCGIAPQDAKTAFFRHATSKLRDAGGLEAIGTLGFRGEALAAIAAVSRIRLLSCECGAKEGVSLSLDAGEVTDFSPAGCPEGTSILVGDLFFNTPARQKFMKSDRAEGAAVLTSALRSAISRPDVSMRFIRDGKTEFHTPGDGRADSCLYSLLGREFFAGLREVESSFDGVKVSGFVSSPDAARGNRSHQFFNVNGRPIRSLTLQAALEQAYANLLPSGRFPSCALYIEISPGSVDVNVHPAKTEVKFVSDKQVFDGVYYAALGGVGAVRGDTAETSAGALTGDKQDTESESTEVPQGVGAVKHSENAWRSNSPAYTQTASAEYSMLPRQSGAPESRSGDRGTGVGRDDYGFLGEYPKSNIRHTHGSAVREGDLGVYDAPPMPQLQSARQDSAQADAARYRVVGEALNTYIVAEYRDSIWLIDKHAAHERIHFDALSRADFEPMPQALITPVVCRTGHEDAACLLAHAELLERLGFAIEDFGGGAVAVRVIPSDIELDDTEQVLSDICGALNHGETPATARDDAVYRAIACKAAIKAGKASGIKELEALAARVLSGEVTHCPHGRPVAFELTRAELARSFKRT